MQSRGVKELMLSSLLMRPPFRLIKFIFSSRSRLHSPISRWVLKVWVYKRWGVVMKDRRTDMNCWIALLTFTLRRKRLDVRSIIAKDLIMHHLRRELVLKTFCYGWCCAHQFMTTFSQRVGRHVSNQLASVLYSIVSLVYTVLILSRWIVKQVSVACFHSVSTEK